MTAVTTRPAEAASTYRRTFGSGVLTILAANGVLAAWAVVIMLTTSSTLGLAGLAVAAVALTCDARFNTPTSIDVGDAGVTLGYWHRRRGFDARSVVLTHDVPRDRFTLVRRGHRRPLVRFRETNALEAARAFVAAGVEIVSR